MPRRPLPGLLAVTALTLLVAAISTVARLEVPPPTGDFAVGRTTLLLVDAARSEPATADVADHRSVPLTIWYPAEAGTGTPAPYVQDLAVIADGLVASGAIGRAVAWGLGHVQDPARADAAPLQGGPSFPVLLLSPGNATNVAFYAALAEDLASHGWAVVGVDHPFQSAAVRTSAGVAVHDPDEDGQVPGPAAGEQRDRVTERVLDLRFTLDELAGAHADGTLLGGRLDLGTVGALGHSNGGLAAVELCRADVRVQACANLDGQGAGGPLSTDQAVGAPEQPLLVLTKETELHPQIAARLEDAGEGAVRAVLPAASHDGFTDGALFAPRLTPFPRASDHVITTSRGVLRAFFDRALRGASATVLGDIDARTDLYLEVYPLGGRPPLPRGGS